MDTTQNGDRHLDHGAIGLLLGISERAARDWVRRSALPVTPTRPARVREDLVRAAAGAQGRTLADARPPPATPEAVGGAPGDRARSAAPLEAAYRATGTAPETGLAPLARTPQGRDGHDGRYEGLLERNRALASEVGALRERQTWHEGALAQASRHDGCVRSQTTRGGNDRILVTWHP